MGNCVALTVFSKLNGHHSRHERESKFRMGDDVPRKEGSEHPHSLQEAESWVVKTTETIKIALRVKDCCGRDRAAETSGKSRSGV
jgi:hypothetical protein